ncbi:hypothetical protein NC652_035494 [Populus alba x Populus x berolinensis]|uniref:Uncharacterized protein n=1 Tax=Populus alba x Populus x berolinensis TaxID=444605 RepID=A0AAD6LQG2_9ROSI|nr:hypothetical protein NC652_035494 [Populus alba x Populus x berolinensis]KAJ6971125.1 hypothetical protein NC653_035409 [Populus alba x Populus x berolinensis]
MIKDTQTNPGGKSRAEAAMNRSDQQHSSGQQNIPGDIIEDRTCWQTSNAAAAAAAIRMSLFIPTKIGLSSHLISYGLYGR